jgi:uncharacterized protein (DUF111 family)
MRHLWFDITAGVAGDMLLGCLLDAGAPLPQVQAAVDQVVPGAVHLSQRSVTRAGQRATKLDVEVLVEDPPHRTWREIHQLLSQAALNEQTKSGALATFKALALAEARAHGSTPDEVHFHEVGALDSIADIVGAHEALRLLGIESCSASAVALGSGRVAAAHGDIPVPVPAVAELAVGWSTVSVEYLQVNIDAREGHHRHRHEETGGSSHHHDTPAPVLTAASAGELATPTGLALIRTVAASCGTLPAMRVDAIGVGAGGRDVPNRPNTTRALIGELSPTSTHDHTPTRVVELMANVDDMDPRMWPGAIDAMLAAGALDAWLVPIHMKKGRPAFTVHALVTDTARTEVLHVLLSHTTTLGVREVVCDRTILDRAWRHLSVAGESLQVKVASMQGRVVHAAAEFSSISRIAEITHTSENDIAQRAAAAIVSAGLTPGSEVVE